jgi:hypothetical protein
MARKTSSELEAIKKKYNQSRLWSWSRYNCYKTSKYEYFLKYVKKEKETRQSIYSISGALAHEIIEKFYNGQIKYEEMIDLYETGLLNFNLMDLKYERSDDEKNQKIAEKYEACIRHFFKNHKVIPYKLMLEKFVLIKIGSYLFQGFIDCCHKENGKYIITDWKTSSIYQGKKIDKEKGQLILYAEALRQNGVKLEDVIIQWNFLKYINITFMQKNGKEKTMTAERHSWVGKIASKLKMNLKDIGWNSQEIEDALDYSLNFNTIDNLPKEIIELYTFSDCYVQIPYNQQEIDTLKEDIINTITEISKKEKEYELNQDDKVFWEEVTDEQSYYFANLSGYNANQHKPYAEYLLKQDMFLKDEYKVLNNIEKDDTSWLDELNL